MAVAANGLNGRAERVGGRAVGGGSAACCCARGGGTASHRGSTNERWEAAGGAAMLPPCRRVCNTARGRVAAGAARLRC